MGANISMISTAQHELMQNSDGKLQKYFQLTNRGFHHHFSEFSQKKTQHKKNIYDIKDHVIKILISTGNRKKNHLLAQEPKTQLNQTNKKTPFFKFKIR